MRYPAFVVAMALVAIVVAACGQKQAGSRPQLSRVSWPQEDRNPPTGQEPRGEQNPGVRQESEAGNEAHDCGNTQDAEESAPDEKLQADEEAEGDEKSGNDQESEPDDDSETGEKSPPGDGPKEKPDTDGDDEEEPLLLLDDDEPLLLLDDEEEEESSKGPVADNSRCHHCHLNYKDEELAVVHAKANISCAKCHGNCDEHIADESWASGGNGTPPEIMYPREKINPFCLDCHARDEIGTSIPDHKRFFAGTAKEKYCTDCHGDHRLTERKCKWK